MLSLPRNRLFTSSCVRCIITQRYGALPCQLSPPLSAVLPVMLCATIPYCCCALSTDLEASRYSYQQVSKPKNFICEEINVSNIVKVTKNRLNKGNLFERLPLLPSSCLSFTRQYYGYWCWSSSVIVEVCISTSDSYWRHHEQINIYD